jgi:hypothetical protein
LSGFTHPAFEPYRGLLARLQGRTDMDALNAMAELLDTRHAQNGKALRFASLPGACSAAQYEQAIADSGIVPTRADNLHDFLNALVWLRFPLLKSTLNQRHCQSLAQQPGEGKQRGRLRDQLTLLDESGMLVTSGNSALLELLRGKNWVALFWDNRAEVVQHMRFVVVGHGLLEKCLAPFPGMTAKCLCLHTPENSLGELDKIAAMAVQDTETLALPPLPVQGVPGWDDNESSAYYRNTEIFRPARTPSPSA